MLRFFGGGGAGDTHAVFLSLCTSSLQKTIAHPLERLSANNPPTTEIAHLRSTSVAPGHQLDEAHIAEELLTEKT